MAEEALARLLTLPTKERRQCVETLIRIFRNVEQNPEEEKYRRLKTTNKTFNGDVWRHDAAQELLLLTGWELGDEAVHLPQGIRLTDTLQLLLDNREIKPDQVEWVEENKVIVPNADKAHEEELRKKALAQKEKEMAALKKDMADRKAIKDRILAEHRNDQKTKRITQPSVAVPRGAGGSARMDDFKDGGG